MPPLPTCPRPRPRSAPRSKPSRCWNSTSCTRSSPKKGGRLHPHLCRARDPLHPGVARGLAAGAPPASTRWPQVRARPTWWKGITPNCGTTWRGSVAGAAASRGVCGRWYGQWPCSCMPKNRRQTFKRQFPRMLFMSAIPWPTQFRHSCSP